MTLSVHHQCIGLFFTPVRHVTRHWRLGSLTCWFLSVITEICFCCSPSWNWWNLRRILFAVAVLYGNIGGAWLCTLNCFNSKCNKIMFCCIFKSPIWYFCDYLVFYLNKLFTYCILFTLFFVYMYSMGHWGVSWGGVGRMGHHKCFWTRTI